MSRTRRRPRWRTIRTEGSFVARTFQRRFVAFVDILGFKSLVGRMTGDAVLFRTVRDTLKELQRQASKFGKYREERNAPRPGRVRFLPDIDLQMTAFSDCFV